MALNYNLRIDQGANKAIEYNIEVLTDPLLPESVSNPYVAFDLANWTLSMQVRKTPDSPVTLITKTSGSGIDLTGTTGQFVLNFDPIDTSAIVFAGSETTLVYDIEATDGTQVLRLVQGLIYINRNITR